MWIRSENLDTSVTIVNTYRMEGNRGKNRENASGIDNTKRSEVGALRAGERVIDSTVEAKVLLLTLLQF